MFSLDFAIDSLLFVLKFKLSACQLKITSKLFYLFQVIYSHAHIEFFLKDFQFVCCYLGRLYIVTKEACILYISSFMSSISQNLISLVVMLMLRKRL